MATKSEKNDSPKGVVVENVKEFGDGSELKVESAPKVDDSTLAKPHSEGGDEDGARDAAAEGEAGKVEGTRTETREVDLSAADAASEAAKAVTEADQAIAGVKDSEGYGGYDGSAELYKIRPADAAPVRTSQDEQREMQLAGRDEVRGAEREEIQRLTKALDDRSRS